MDNPAPIQPSSPSRLPTILLNIVVFVLLSVTGLLAFQNYQLQSQISLLESKINTKPTPVSTPTTAPTPTEVEGRFCGGIAGLACPSGFSCKLDGSYPDAGGKCEASNKEGTLEAVVIVSPTCPGAVRPGDNCEGPYPNHDLNIINLADQKITTVKTDKAGKFAVALIAGSYKIQNTAIGIGKDIKNPNFDIYPGKITTQRFDIDTGIR